MIPPHGTRREYTSAVEVVKNRSGLRDHSRATPICVVPAMCLLRARCRETVSRCPSSLSENPVGLVPVFCLFLSYFATYKPPTRG